jgi:hypothetical protein
MSQTLVNDILFGIFAIIVGVVGSWAIYWLLDLLVRRLPAKTQEKLGIVPLARGSASRSDLAPTAVSDHPLFIHG